MNQTQLLEGFNRAMLGIYDAARRLKPAYTPSDFLTMVTTMGGKATADKLLSMDKPSDGFGTLLLRGKDALKLSVEYVVLQNPWRALFEPEQLAVARKRLVDVNCPLPPEDTEEGEDEIDEGEDAGATSGPDRVVFFNNCRNREHEKLFGKRAFFDLYAEGHQASQAVGLVRGQKCVAATMDGGKVVFTWYSFLVERRCRERHSAVGSAKCRVFFGDALLAESMAKEKAVGSKRYGSFFNVKGHFKRQSTIWGAVAQSDQPAGLPVETAEVRKLRERLQALQKPGVPPTPKTLKQIHRVLKTYERPSAITRYVKQTRGSACQLCGYPGFEMKNKQFYCESHHLFHLAKNPPPVCLGPEYLVVLCATCHRKLHHTEVSDPVKAENGWKMRVEGKDVLFKT